MKHHKNSRIEQLCSAAVALMKIAEFDGFNDDDFTEMNSVLWTILRQVRKEPILSEADAVEKIMIAVMDITDTDADDDNLSMIAEAHNYLAAKLTIDRQQIRDVAAGIRRRQGGGAPA
jgi:hypothetical protein